MLSKLEQELIENNVEAIIDHYIELDDNYAAKKISSLYMLIDSDLMDSELNNIINYETLLKIYNFLLGRWVNYAMHDGEKVSLPFKLIPELQNLDKYSYLESMCHFFTKFVLLSGVFERKCREKLNDDFINERSAALQSQRFFEACKINPNIADYSELHGIKSDAQRNMLNKEFIIDGNLTTYNQNQNNTLTKHMLEGKLDNFLPHLANILSHVEYTAKNMNWLE